MTVSLTTTGETVISPYTNYPDGCNNYKAIVSLFLSTNLLLSEVVSNVTLVAEQDSRR